MDIAELCSKQGRAVHVLSAAFKITTCFICYKYDSKASSD